MNKENVSNYYYGSYVNYKAFKDYHITNNIDDKYFKSNHCLILAFIVERYYKHLKTPSISYKNEKYLLMNTNYILNNLVYLKIAPRQFKNCLSQLKTNGLIKVFIENKTNRYIFVNSDLIKLCYTKDWTITPIDFLIKNKPDVWKVFKNEWEPHFKNKESFKKFIDDFNDNRIMEGENFNTSNIYDHLINSVRNKLYSKK